VVPKASAVVLGHADAEAIAIHADHTSMVRYPSKKDAGYVTVSEHLRLMATDATDSVKQRWEGERRPDNGKEAYLNNHVCGQSELTLYAKQHEAKPIGWAFH
jgi:hypothetical protein